MLRKGSTLARFTLLRLSFPCLRRKTTLTRFLLSITCLAILATGCSEKQIEVQTVPVEESSYSFFREQQADQPAAKPPAKSIPRRMIVGMYDQPEATWFFKATGDQEIVDAKQNQIFELLRGVTFEGDEPKWKLPEGWTVGPKKTSRFAPLATLVIDAESKTQLTISSLGPNQDLRANANRWRGQLGLEPWTQDQVETEFTKADGDDFYLFDVVGTGSGQMGGRGAAPFANAPFLQRQAMQAKLDAAKRQSPAAAALKYEAPDGWKESQTSGMVSATRFTKKSAADPDIPTMITFTQMSAAVNNWPSNVERWARQAGQILADDELATATEEFKIGGQASKLIELLDGSGQAIVAVMTVENQNAWFFKLTGDKESVQKELPTFRELLKTIKFN